ncbi:MAG: 30S ribosomal protein S9 [Phycisphaerae bacterium]
MAEDTPKTQESQIKPAEPPAAQAAPAPTAPVPAASAGPAASPSPEQAAPAAPAAPPAEAKPQPLTAPPLPEGVHYIWGIGRRKKAIARVRIRPGTGKFLVNKREKDAYFCDVRDRETVMVPLQAANMVGSWDVFVNVNGGGFAGQAGAVSLGLSRALAKAFPDALAALRDKSLLTRDARMKERKKYGQKGARKRFQYSKR